MLRNLLFATLLVLASASPAVEKRQSSFDNFVSSERAIALNGALANIGGTNSSIVKGADSGIVVASPSTVNPDYFFTWTRDSALTYAMIVEEFEFGNSSLRKAVENYTLAQAFLQTVTNPSGTLWPAGEGLGEPKFYTNKTRFDGTWGRPQRDGPALRASTLISFANALLLKKETSIVQQIYWPIILNDLRYVGQYWNETGYDLWEEVHGSSFFTINAEHRALVQGTLLAKAIGTTCEPCNQAPQILCFLQNNFWNKTGNYLLADINVNNVNRSGINTDPILSSIQVFDINATCDAGDFQPCNSKMLATHKVVVDSFRNLYPINKNASAPNAVLVGRYPEDTYYGGNPWPLCTLACAELLYDAVAQFKKAGSLSVDDTSLSFFRDIYPSAKPAVYSGAALSEITTAMTVYADGFVAAVQHLLPANGSLSEQFNSTTGESTSASKLTWSFASFVTMARRRAGNFPPSWGAWQSIANANNGSKCQRTSFNATGRYTPAFAAGAPPVSTACVSRVVLTVNATTQFGQNVYAAGNTTLLGGSLYNASAVILPGNPGNYTSTVPEWYFELWLPASVPVQYLYVLQLGNGTFVFENITRNIQVPGCGSGNTLTTRDKASFPGFG